MEKQISYEDYLQLEQEFKKKEQSMEERLWIDSNVGAFDDILRSNYNKSVEEFSRVVIAYLSQLTNAYQGVFYIVDQDQEIVEAVASYACNVDKLQQKEFAFGEGLIGEAVLSKEKIFFDDLPTQIENDKSVSIKVKFNPKAALVIPLLFNESVYGALELIYLKSLDEKYQLLLDRVSQNIGAMLESILNSGRLQALLNKSQEQTESLRAQEEEMRQNIEEMSATREAQERAQRELEDLKTNLELKVAEQTTQLEESIQKFNLASKATTEGLWDLVMPEDLVTNDDTYFWWADKFRQMLGYENEEDFPNRLDSWANLLHPDHKEQTLAAFQTHLMDFTGNTPYDVEYQLLRKTGEYRWYRAVGHTLRDENGKPIRVAGTLIDIQEAKDLEQIRKDLVEKFDLATKTTTEGLWDLVMPEDLVTNDDTYFWWSDNFRHMLGYESEEDFPNRLDSWSNLLHPDHKEQTLAAFSAHLMDYSGETPYNVEYQLLRKTGEYRWYRAVGNTMRAADGKPLRVAGSLIDIQEAKDLEQIRKDLVEKFDLATKTTTEGLWDLVMPEDLVTNDDTYFWWSDNFRRMLGYESEEDFPNRLDSWSNLLHPDHKEQTLAAFSAHLMDYSGETPYNVEYQLLRKTGEYRWYRAVGNTMRAADGKPLRVAGSLIDIQEQKDLENIRKELIERFDLAANTTTEGLWDLTLPDNLETDENTYVWFSDNFRRMLGFKNEDDFPSRFGSWASLLHPDDQERTLQAYVKHLMDFSGKTSYNEEYRLRQNTDVYRWYRVIGNTLRNEEGKPLRSAGTLIDIQEQKDLEKLRKELVERFDLAANTTTEGLWDMTMPDDLKTDDDTYFWWADNFRKMLGYESEEDFPNRLGSWSNLLHPNHKEPTLAAFSAHLLDFTGNTPYDVEYKLLRKTGEYRWYRAVGNTLRNEEGKPLRVAGTLIDIQEKKELDHLKENVEILSTISNEGLWSTQVEPSSKLNPNSFLYLSPTYQKLLGFNESENLPQQFDSWISRLHPDDTQFVLDNFQEFINSSEQGYNAEYRLKMKNGRYRWFRSKTVKKLLGDESNQVKLVGILTDIHDTKR